MVVSMVVSGRSRISHGEGIDLMGAVYSRGSYISNILYVETKGSGPLGGGGMCLACPLDLQMVV